MPGADYDDAVNVLIQGITQLDVQEQLQPSNEVDQPSCDTVLHIKLLIQAMTKYSDTTATGKLQNSGSFFY